MDDLQFLEKLNNTLVNIEPDYNDIPSKPHIWVLGLPRSGTTLTMQLLSKHLNVGYVDNIMARFWKAPCTGAKLSRIILGDRRSESFSSDHGTTIDPGGPHEFSYFWHHVFGVKDYQKINFSRIEQETNWQEICNILNNIASEMPGPMLYKALWPSYFLERFFAMFPKSLFVVIERPTLEISASLTRAREQYYGDRSKWWSMTFDGYEQYLHLSYSDQIAIQLRELSRIYFEPLEKIPRAHVLHITYKELCKSPNKILNTICSKLEKIGIEEPKYFGVPPEHFISSRSYAVDDKTINELQDSLDRHYPDHIRSEEYNI